MALNVLGKRKRTAHARPDVPPSPSDSVSDDSDNAQDLQERFRRAFEAKFKPLDIAPVKDTHGVDPVDDQEDDWSGISDEEELDEEEDQISKVQIVEHGVIAPTELLSKAEMKAFMVRLVAIRAHPKI